MAQRRDGGAWGGVYRPVLVLPSRMARHGMSGAGDDKRPCFGSVHGGRSGA